MPGQYVIEPRAIEQSHVLTDLIERGLDESTTIAERIAPITPTDERRIQIAIRERHPPGLAPFKAQNANTPTRIGGASLTRIFLELPDIEEQEPLTAQDLRDLRSRDPDMALRKARDLVQIGEELRMRNRARSNWMRWMAFRDQLTITYETGASVAVDYDLDNTDDEMDHNHIITLTGADTWDESTSDPIGDIDTWRNIFADDAGSETILLHMNWSTYQTLRKHPGLTNFMTETYGPLKLLNRESLQTILELEDGGIVIENGFYQEESRTPKSEKIKFLPDGFVMATTPYVMEGVPIARMYDGPVVFYNPVTQDLEVSRVPGAMAEIYVNPGGKLKLVRVSSSRMIWMRRESFLWIQVY